MSIDHAPPSVAEHHKGSTLDEARRIVEGYYPYPYRPNGEPTTRDIIYIQIARGKSEWWS